MKKNITIKALLLLLVVALTSGCIKAEEGLKISSGSVEYTYTIGMMKSYLSMMTGEGDPFKDTTKDVKDSGFTVEDYDDGSYKGIKAVKKLGSLEELSTTDEIKDLTLSKDKMEGAKLFQKTSEGFFKTTYKAKFKVTLMDDVENGINTSGTTDTTPTTQDDTSTTTGGATDEEIKSPDEPEDYVKETIPDDDSENIMESDDTITTGTDTSTTQNLDDISEELNKSMVVNFTVELPSTPGKNNATKVDGKKLIWDLKTFKDGVVEFEFSITNTTNILLVGGGALLLLIIVIALIVMISKKKGKVEPAEFADRPIPEVVKENVVTPTEPTNDTPALTPVGAPKVEVEAPAVTEPTTTISEEVEEAKVE